MPTLHEPRREIDEGERKYCIEKLKSEHQLPSDYPRGEGGDGRPPCLGPAPLMINGGYQAKGTPLPPPFALATRVIFLEWFSGKLEIIDDICVFDWTSPEWDSSIFFLLLFPPLSFFLRQSMIWWERSMNGFLSPSLCLCHCRCGWKLCCSSETLSIAHPLILWRNKMSKPET